MSEDLVSCALCVECIEKDSGGDHPEWTRKFRASEDPPSTPALGDDISN